MFGGEGGGWGCCVECWAGGMMATGALAEGRLKRCGYHTVDATLEPVSPTQADPP